MKWLRLLQSGGGIALFLAVVGVVTAAWARARAAEAEALRAHRRRRKLEDQVARFRENGLVDRAGALAEAATAIEGAAIDAERNRMAAEERAARLSGDLETARTPEEFLAAIAARGLAVLLVALLGFAGPLQAQELAPEPPGSLTTWASPPGAEAFRTAAGEAGWVAALDAPRLQHWLQEIDAGRRAQATLKAVELERDRWRELAMTRAEELAAARALLEAVTGDRDRLRQELAELDEEIARRPRAKRASFIAGLAVGAALTWEVLDD